MAYRVGDSERWSEWLQFTSFVDSEKKFSFLYVGDAQKLYSGTFGHA